MKEAKNRASMSHEMSTKNRGVVLPAERGTIRGPMDGPGGRAARNAFEEPDEYEVGPNGFVGGNDWDSMNDGDGDFDGDPWSAR